MPKQAWRTRIPHPEEFALDTMGDADVLDLFRRSNVLALHMLKEALRRGFILTVAPERSRKGKTVVRPHKRRKVAKR